MWSDTIQTRIDPPAGTIILNRPERRNALTRAMIGQLERTLTRLHRDPQVRAVILTGAGSAFCAGADLHEMRETAEGEHALLQWGQDAEAFCDLLVTMLELPKPIIAAVNGPAVGAGAGLVLASDIVVGGDQALFGLPEPRRGIVAGVVSPLLAFRIGGSHAARLLLTSSLVESEESRRLGIFHECVATDRVWARAMQLVDQCAQGAPEAIGLTKRLLHETIGGHLPSQLAAGAAMSASSRTTEVAAEGLAAFIEKRPTSWQP